MDMVGEVFGKTEEQVATLQTDTVGDYLFVSVMSGSNLMVRFPLAANADINEVALRTGNIINQTGIVNNPCRVVAREVE